MKTIGDIFLVSAFNHIDHVMKIELNKKKHFAARQSLETAQRNIAYVLRMKEK